MRHTDYSCSFSINLDLVHSSILLSAGRHQSDTMDNFLLSQAQTSSPDVSSGTVGRLVSRFSSLDMNSTPEEAYEQAVTINLLQQSPHPLHDNHNSITLETDRSSKTHGLGVAGNHTDFLHLLARFHHAVRPLSSVSLPSTASSTPYIVDLDEFGSEYTEPPHGALGINTLATTGTSTPAIPSVFSDMNSLLRKAEDMVDFLRRDVEDMMKRARRKDRAGRERERGSSVEPQPNKSTDEARDSMSMDDVPPILPTFHRSEGEPRLRKVPIARRSTPELCTSPTLLTPEHFTNYSYMPLASWFSPSTALQIQDPHMSPTPPSRRRPIITPKRLQPQLVQQATSSSFRAHLNQSPFSTEATIDTCSSQLTQLKISDKNPEEYGDDSDAESIPSCSSPRTPPPARHRRKHSSPQIRIASPSHSGPSPLRADNPIRMYAGYNHPYHYKTFSMGGGADPSIAELALGALHMD